MKKLFFILFSISILTSCGPRRLSCGPGKRCVETYNTDQHKIIVKNIEAV